MTAFYMFRLLFLTFWGEFRGRDIGRPSVLAAQEAAHAGSSEHEEEEGHHHHEEDLTAPGYPPHESPWQMTVPLIILAHVRDLRGRPQRGAVPLRSRSNTGSSRSSRRRPTARCCRAGAPSGRSTSEKPLMLGGLFAFFAGTGLSPTGCTSRAPGEPAKRMAEAAPGLYRLVLTSGGSTSSTTRPWSRWSTRSPTRSRRSTRRSSTASSRASRRSSSWGSARCCRVFQNGVVHVYAAFMVVGLAAVSWFFVAPHANATVADLGRRRLRRHRRAGPRLRVSLGRER